MEKITLDIKNDNLETVLLILESLKDGLIENIKVNKSPKKYKPMYQPPINKVIKEGEPQNGKYMNPSKYKESLTKGK